MTCPNCGQEINRNYLIKINIKRFKNVDVVYDTLCPFCRAEIGRMYWGKLVPNPNFPQGDWMDNETRRPPIPTLVKEKKREKMDASESYDRYPCICPYCGMELPDEIGLRNYAGRGPEERRMSERRKISDRRVIQDTWTGPERRVESRRKHERRLPEDFRAENEKEENLSVPVSEGRGYPDNRHMDRRKGQRSISFYDRRERGSDRRRRKDGYDEIDWKV